MARFIFELYMPVLPIIIVLEANGNLDIDNEIHIFCLHYVFIPRVNASLRQFIEAWNNHPLSSELYLTPIQLWISGLSRVMLPDLESLTEVILLVLSVLFMDFITL